MTKKDEIKNPQEEEVTEGQDTTIQKNVNDKELPAAEKETIANKQAAAPTAEPNKNETGAEPMKDVGGDKENNASDASAEVEADKPAHDQSKDPIETPMKDDSDPKKKVSEMKKDEMDEMEDEKEDVKEMSHADKEKKEMKDMEKEEEEPKEMKKDMDEMAKKDMDEEEDEVKETKEEPEEMAKDDMDEEEDDVKEELTAGQKKLPPALQKAIKDKKDKKETKEVDEMAKKDMDETEDEPKEMKKDMDEMSHGDKEKKEELKGDQKKLDKDGDGDIDAKDLAKVRKDGANESVEEMKKDDMDEEEDEPKEMKKDMDEDANEVKAEKQPTEVEKNANDKNLPPQDKATLDMAKGDTDAEQAEADKGPHDQGKDPIETPMKDDSDPKKGVSEMKKDDMDEEEDEPKEMKKDMDEMAKDSKDEMAKDDMDEKDEMDEMKKDDMDEEEDEVKEMKSKKDEMAKDTEEMAKDDMEEDVDLDEDFKQKAAIVFETAVNEKVNAKVKEIEEKLEAENADRMKDLEEKFSQYTDYATEEWLKENALEIKYSLRTEIAETFMKDLKGLFEKNYIDIPEDDIKVVDELTEAVEGYKDQMSEKDELVEKLQEKVLAFERADITTEVSEGLTETQKIRLEKLGESVEAGSTEEYKEKLEALKESYFDNPETAAKALSSYGDEVFTGQEGESQPETDTANPVSQYVRYLSKTALK